MNEDEQIKRLDYLIYHLAEESPNHAKFLKGQNLDQISFADKKRIFRSIMNVREAMPLDEELLQIQDDYLQEELENKKITRLTDLTSVSDDIYLWQGDITTLEVDAIVNAANSQMLGCFIPCHACIDNAIHSSAGFQLRLACDDIMKKQGELEETGKAKITKAYNLPSKYILHTVGPIISSWLLQEDCDLLASCYQSCLKLAESNKLKSLAFCCISTGEYRFPNDAAAEIAVKTVRSYKKRTGSKMKIIFNVFKDLDYELYNKLFTD